MVSSSLSFELSSYLNTKSLGNFLYMHAPFGLTPAKCEFYFLTIASNMTHHE